ncbi:hypothetical protein AB1Y20_018026 [Prymnesium parvum]|uniref:Thiol-disulfide oxidoreductase DCC n=1 Tax=Prymnesium parvum TaxID=97485 RepID=A0AB34JR18_PRYPA
MLPLLAAVLPLALTALHAASPNRLAASAIRKELRVSCFSGIAAPLPSDAGQQVSTAPVSVLYDGLCMVCLTNKKVLTWFDKRGEKVRFVDIRSRGYDPASNGGISFDDAMRTFHVIDADGTVLEGADAVMMAYSAAGLGWLMALLRFPLIRILIDGAYRVVSRHRHTISRWMPGGAALARTVDSLNEMESAAHGVSCDEEEECMLDYDEVEDKAA